MSSSLNGLGGSATMYLKHCRYVSTVVISDPRDTYLQAQVELLLLLVNYTETEVYLVCLLEFWLHTHDLGESFLCVLERAVAVV